MVLTCPVRSAETDERSAGSDDGTGTRRPTRRSVLRVAAVLALVAAPAATTGCGLLDRKPEPPPEPDPIAPLIAGALDLAVRYDAAVAAFPDLAPRLGPVAEAHRAHAEELSRVTGTPLPSPPAGGSAGPGASSGPGASPGAPGGGDRAATLAALTAAEQQGRQAAVTVCLAAPAERAALVGSVAAARAAHLEVLR